MKDKNSRLFKWKQKALKEVKSNSLSKLNRSTLEKIELLPLYRKKDLKNKSHINSLPGFEPFLRGTSATMYTNRPWTIRQYSGFSTPEETNKFFINSLKSGQKGLSVAFDLATHRGFDSDHKDVLGDIGKAGVPIDTVEDMKVLFKNIPLDKISVSMTMSGAVLPIFAYFIVTAEEQGISLDKLSGTIQNDILKEFMVRNTFIYPPEPSMRIVTDIIEFTTLNMPNFNSISISGYHMQEAGASIIQELAYAIANGLEYLKYATERGLNVDDFAPRVSFFFCVGMNFFMEIAKLRAARVLWRNWVKKLFKPKNTKSLILRTHCQTSGVSLTEQQPLNNLVRTTVEAISATLGGTLSLHTNSFDEAIGLPTEESAKIARNTQLILQNETDITSTIDPLAGSYFIENLTSQIIKNVNKEIKKILEMGGMVQSIQQGYPKSEIEKMSAIKQAEIDSGKQKIIGLNAFKDEDNYIYKHKEIDNKKVRLEQIKKINKIKEKRDINEVKKCLEKLKIAAKDESQNLLKYSIKAAKARATVGEISKTIQSVFGNYKIKITSSSNQYKNNLTNAEDIKKIKNAIDVFFKKYGEKPKILFAKIGQDGHDRGLKVVASAYKDFGVEVVIGELFQTPKEVVNSAIKENVHIIGISTLAAGHKTLIPIIVDLLHKKNAEDITIVCGGIIPKKDYKFLHENGVSNIFGPGTPITKTVLKTIETTSKNLDRLHNYRISRINKN